MRAAWVDIWFGIVLTLVGGLFGFASLDQDVVGMAVIGFAVSLVGVALMGVGIVAEGVRRGRIYSSA